jgi:Zn finger protein HypA/HybF involved in hydrogenase expression
MRVRYDWTEVQRFYDKAQSRDACARKFGFTLVAWYMAIKRGRLRAHVERAKRVDWAAVQRYYDEGHTFRECRAQFVFASASWAKAVRRGDIQSRLQRWSIERVLSEAKCRNTVKRHLIEAGILKNVCEECGLSEWRGRPLVIQLDHRNGVRDDNRLENLRMLCPNCHSQTETFASRNRRGKPLKQK